MTLAEKASQATLGGHLRECSICVCEFEMVRLLQVLEVLWLLSSTMSTFFEVSKPPSCCSRSGNGPPEAADFIVQGGLFAYALKTSINYRLLDRCGLFKFQFAHLRLDF